MLKLVSYVLVHKVDTDYNLSDNLTKSLSSCKRKFSERGSCCNLIISSRIILFMNFDTIDIEESKIFRPFFIQARQ